MDNGRYMQYRYENPVVNTFITTYEHVTMFPEQLTNEEIVVLAVFGFLAIYVDFPRNCRQTQASN